MIQYKQFELANGLKVLVNEDPSTPLVAVNLLYHVGSKNETIDKTGFAHLFEHFMFEGSKHIESFDGALQKAGGDNNAFTTNDITNYYETLPASNLETAFWLESDRMLELNFNQENLDNQISVVCEEFKENYINKPYGDMWHLISDLAYKVHPYKWPTIGLKLEHIEQFNMQEVRAFFDKYYVPNNATLSVSGGVTFQEVERLANKYFAAIPSGEPIAKSYNQEPLQTEKRTLHVHKPVPVPAIFMGYHICDRLHNDYYSTDLLSDLLGAGSSSRLFQKLVKEKEMFSELSAFISGTDDAGLLLIEGKLNPGFELEDAEKEIFKVIEEILTIGVQPKELEKVLNKTLNYMAFSNESTINRAFNMAYFSMIDRLDWIKNEKDEYLKVTTDSIQTVAKQIFKEENCSTLFYHADNK